MVKREQGVATNGTTWAKWKAAIAFQLFTLLIFSFMLASCASKSVPNGCKDLESDLNYYDSATFDSRLSRSLSCKPDKIKINIPTPEYTRAIPKRLDNWLAAVDESGGEVKVVKDPNRESEYAVKSFDGGLIVGILFDMVEIAKIAYQAIEDRVLYGPAKGYDATIYYEDGTGMITEVVFSRKTLNN